MGRGRSKVASGGYTSFTGDVLDRTRKAFKGPATEQSAFFKKYSNFEKLVSSLTDGQKDTFAKYAAGRFMGYSMLDYTPEKAANLLIDTTSDQDMVKWYRTVESNGWDEKKRYI